MLSNALMQLDTVVFSKAEETVHFWGTIFSCGLTHIHCERESISTHISCCLKIKKRQCNHTINYMWSSDLYVEVVVDNSHLFTIYNHIIRVTLWLFIPHISASVTMCRLIFALRHTETERDGQGQYESFPHYTLWWQLHLVLIERHCW